jgi:uncharacterized protein YlzI (FlbEa/FlbD family)
MNARHAPVPVFVFADLKDDTTRAVNALHVQTFIPNPFGSGTLITFANGDTITVAETFDAVLDTFICDRPDG